MHHIIYKYKNNNVTATGATRVLASDTGVSRVLLLPTTGWRWSVFPNQLLGGGEGSVGESSAGSTPATGEGPQVVVPVPGAGCWRGPSVCIFPR